MRQLPKIDNDIICSTSSTLQGPRLQLSDSTFSIPGLRRRIFKCFETNPRLKLKQVMPTDLPVMAISRLSRACEAVS
jgi:hypothetical protein